MKKMIMGIVTTLCLGTAVGVMAIDSVTVNAVKLVFGRESLQNPPVSVLTLEETKIKNMTDWDYCRVDDEYDAWYFYGDGSAKGDNNPEIRFVADGVQTTTKPYTLIPIEVGAFSFEYCIVNNAPTGVIDLPSQDYIVQILGADTLYPVIPVTVEEDGDWHTITVDGSSSFYGNTGGDATTYGEYRDNFCGFLFKMGGLDGEFMIRNITLYDFDGEEILPENDKTEDEGTAGSQIPDYSNEENGESSRVEETGNEQISDKTSSAISFDDKKGCGSFGVGSLTLGALVAVGVMMGITAKKRK